MTDQVAVGVDEGLLHGVLAARRPDEARRVALEDDAVALHDRLEGPLVALAGEGHQAFVGLQTQQRGACEARGRTEQSGLHGITLTPGSGAEQW